MEGNISDHNNSFPYNPYSFVDLKQMVPLRYAVPVNGYISPVLICFTVVTNILVVVVLLKKHMRTPTNAILAGMAVSDMFTGLFPLPVFIYFFALDNYKEKMSVDWCVIYYFFGEYIPTIFHTASIWLTVTLAVQRYIYICHSLQARRWCTMQNVLIATAIIYAISTLAQVSRFLEADFEEVEVPSNLNPNVTIKACYKNERAWMRKHMNLYYNVYFWFRVICIHLIPCTFLVVLNALLILTMRQAQIRRMQLLKQNKKSESRKLKDSNCTTLMLVAVVGLFLLVEFPMGIIMILNIIQNTFEGIMIFDHDTFSIVSLMSNLCILLSYPSNFFIYCGMSRQFRETFKRMITGQSMPIDRECSQYMTLPVENGNGRTQMTGDGETVL